ncbi:hypothetical protein ANCDUO_15391 [Ancylostoma duodenale]|uniref:Uncharacterized protein n=1 Tax=Ancylostoma duodenale TaxID=51022 RepID=A0A0C2CDR2_9BILA|nr:hypothetical protein ANCDUO_15391 [Ancylostoma duodenale]
MILVPCKNVHNSLDAWMKNENNILDLGYSETFHRRWQYYFCLCSALFANDHIDTIQFTLTKDV